ncbi:MAG: alpha/beta hydrolase [Tessaracoccus sp.]|uniref:alpha/beta hydrolase n=1 Tax=Tessaracoccus sp. TaxID=1971211 RepID=UPI001EB7EE2F|nr:alpha/beta hydrolase [Tessaracoccus sp.]MBK7822794.1 alpha/beta hydrolase [Tessaracoccus sp.]
MGEWSPDTELDGYEQLVFPLPEEPTYALEPENSLVATLVRHDAPRYPSALLYLHGWNDYFFQTHLADEIDGLGYDFYALDLRRYGRSLRPKQLAGYVADLTHYFVELDLAVEQLRAEGHDRIVFMGHSTGGLVGSLYANERPGTFAAVILNSPWLELQGNSVLRPATQPVFTAMRAVAPTSSLPASEIGHYRRSIAADQDGEWVYNHNLKGDPAFLLRFGWLAAILAGHAVVASGLDIDCPVFVGVSERSDFRRKWDEALTKADTVLDVERIVSRADGMGRLIVIARFADALHDLVLSAPSVRAEVFKEYARFLRCYAE